MNTVGILIAVLLFLMLFAFGVIMIKETIEAK
jgi:hypothetical protein